MLSQIYSGRRGDAEIIEEYYQHFLTISYGELTEKCIATKNQRIFGVHRQALFLIALNKAAKERGVPTSLEVENNRIISFEGE
ncbi:MAG: hypothetical protein FJY21_02280 [Bacteroidetes bacterium]|nr:hypothetical protein [Bacteroidota bacterium]